MGNRFKAGIMTEVEDLESQPEVCVWNLLFLSGPRQHWWDWLTDPVFRHVCAFGWANDRWIVYDSADIRSRIMVLTASQFDMWIAERETRISDVIQVPVQAGAGLRGRVGLWCVTSVKHLAGLKSSALRPKALHRDLLAAGYERIFNGRESQGTAGIGSCEECARESTG
jgi:hypothetical protein